MSVSGTRQHAFPAHVLALPRVSKAQRDGLLNLSSNELLHPQLPPLLEEILRELNAPVLLSRYATYQLVIRDLAHYHGVTEDRVLATAGSDAAIQMLLEALAATHGRLVLPVPNYDGWAHYAALRGLPVTEISFGRDEPERFSVDAMEEVLVEAAPAVVAVSNPNSPTGFAFSEDEMRRLARICERNGHFLVVDECYVGFCDLSHTHLAESKSVFLVRSFSKTFGLAGGRAASVTSVPENIDYLARWRPEFATSTLTLEVLRGLLRRAERLRALREDVRSARTWLVSELEHSWPQWKVLNSGGNFVNVRLPSAKEAKSVTSSLLVRGVRIKLTHGLPGLERCIRTTVAERSLLEPALDVISEVARSIGQTATRGEA